MSFITTKKKRILIDKCHMGLGIQKLLGCLILGQIAPDVKVWVFSEEKGELNRRTWSYGKEEIRRVVLFFFKTKV